MRGHAMVGIIACVALLLSAPTDASGPVGEPRGPAAAGRPGAR